MEPLKQITDASVLLSYVINLFLTFIIAIVGAFVREIYNYKKQGLSISIIRLLASGIITSVVMVAVMQHTEMNFAIFSLITFFFGMWAFSVIDILMNVKYIAIIVKDVIKELGNPIFKGTANAIEDVRKEIKEEKKAEKEKGQDKEKKEDVKEEPKNETPPAPKEPSVEEFSKEELLRQIRKLEQQVAREVEKDD